MARVHGEMPQTLCYRPTLLDELLTNERLSSYERVFRPANDVELMGVYLFHPENLRLLDRNGLLGNARRACTSAEIRRFQHLANTHRIESLADLRTLVDRCIDDDAVLAARLSPGGQYRFLLVPTLTMAESGRWNPGSYTDQLDPLGC